MKRLLWISSCAILYLVAISVAAGARDITDEPKLGKRDLDLNVPEEISVLFEGGLKQRYYTDVIAALGRRSIIKADPIIDLQGLSPLRLLLEEKRIGELAASHSFLKYLCEINRHICSQEENKGSGTRFRNTKAPSGKVILEPFRCPSLSNSIDQQSAPPLPSYVICIPRVKYETYDTVSYVHHNAKTQRIEDLIHKAGACDALDDKCRQYVANLNPHKSEHNNPFSNTFAGSLYLPIVGYKLTLDVPSRQALDDITKEIDLVIDRLSKDGLLEKNHISIQYVVTTKSYVPQVAQVKKDSQEEPIKDNSEILKILHYSLTKSDIESISPISMGLLDAYVDKEHCDFKSKPAAVSAVIFFEELTNDESANTLKKKRKEADCKKVRGYFEDRFDHATHIAGLLVAQFNNRGISGINPNARLWAYRLNEEQLKRDVDPIAAAGKKGVTKPSVINISHTTKDPGVQTILSSFINRYSNSVLFIVAAGNGTDELSEHSQEISGRLIESTNCQILPACLGSFAAKDTRDNVIGVVALARDGKSLLTSSTGKSSWTNYGDVFDVAAPGEAVSSLYGDSFGKMYGTSVATPFVTGLASLLYAKATTGTPKPREVKDRILATCDFEKDLRDADGNNYVRFGRINFDRALAFEKDTLSLLTTVGGDTFSSVLKDGELLMEQAEFEGKAVPNDELKLKMSRILRISANSDTEEHSYTVAYLYSLTQNINVYRNVKFSPDAKLEVKKTPQSTIKINVNTVLDYVPCSEPLSPGCNPRK